LPCLSNKNTGIKNRFFGTGDEIFYQSVFGGMLQMNTFKEYHATTDPSEDHARPAGSREWHPAHGCRPPNAMEFMPGTDINLSISGDNEDQLSSSYQKRRTVAMPLEKASGAIPSVCARIGLGVNRMVNITAPQA
jgi:PhnB protein